MLNRCRAARMSTSEHGSERLGRCCRMYSSALIALAILGLSFPVPAAWAQTPAASWTVLVYLDGDNNLERDAINDFLEMAFVGSSANVNVIVQFDRIPGYDSRYGDWAGTLRFRVTQGMTPEPANALIDLGEANMGDPQTLTGFITWGQRTFPAQRTAVVLWNHGDGWRTASMRKQERKAICFDDTSGRDALDMSELRQALAAAVAAAGRPIDLLAFDACLMAMIEVDAQLQPYVRFRTASEETEPGTGYPFNTILADLQAHPAWEGRDLATAIVERYYQFYNGETQSAVELGDGHTVLLAQVDLLAQVLIPRLGTSLNAIQAVRHEVQQFYGTYVDLYDLAERLAAAVDDPAVRSAAHNVMNAVQATTLIERHGTYWPGAHGISIFFPAQASGWDNRYSSQSNYLRFSAQTQWDEFLIAYLERLTACTPDSYEPDNDPGSASLLVVGQPQRHSFCPVADRADWVAFEAGAGQTYEIATSELEAYCDTVLRLYDRDGQTVLAEDDDGGSGWASRMVWTSSLPGTYYIQVMEYFGRSGQSTGYTVGIQQAVSPCQADPYEPDDSASRASELAIDGPAQPHTFCPQNDLADWTSVQVLTGQTYVFETRSLGPQVDTVLTLYAGDATTALATDDDGGGEPGASLVRWTCPATGQYLLRVQEKTGRTGPDTRYELSARTSSLTVRGQVRLQGRTTYTGTEVSAQPVGTLAPITATSTALDGTFVLTTTTPCTITAAYPGYLGRQWIIPQTASPSWTLETVVLLGGDVNGDGRIDILDIAFVGARFGGHDPGADINDDGMVDILDLVLTAGNFGQRAP